jgi:formate hydrogenlyase subunit 3/multisubunit Na+/H+ antiporter MnhD subunit
MSALCANHPDVDAIGTCTRCGNFVCTECRAEGEGALLCKSCDVRLGRHPLVRHVPWLAIGLIVHGVLIAGAGLFIGAYGGFYLIELATMPASDDPADNTVSNVVLITMAVMCVTHLVPGVLQAFAGWQLRKSRGRGLAITSLVVGLVTLVGCYCAVTSFAMLVWGLVVLLNGEVARRLAMPGGSASA